MIGNDARDEFQRLPGPHAVGVPAAEAFPAFGQVDLRDIYLGDRIVE